MTGRSSSDPNLVIDPQVDVEIREQAQLEALGHCREGYDGGAVEDILNVVYKLLGIAVNGERIPPPGKSTRNFHCLTRGDLTMRGKGKGKGKEIMVIETASEEFTAALKEVSKYVDSRSTTMADIAITCQDDESSLSIRNENFDLKRHFGFDSVTFGKDGEDPDLKQIDMPAKRLVALMDSVGAPLVRLEAKSKSVLTVKTNWESKGGGRFTIRNPETSLYEDEGEKEYAPWVISTDGQALAAALRHTITAAGKQDFRFNGIWFHIVDEKLRVYAVDGRRICFQELPGIAFRETDEKGINGAFQIPIGTAKALIDMADTDSIIQIGFTLTKSDDSDESRLGNVWFGWDDYFLASKVLEAPMLPYQEVLGAIDDTYIIVVDPGAFGQALKQVSWIKQPTEKYQHFYLSVEDGKLVVKASNNNGEEAEIRLECEATEGGVPARKLQIAFVLDILPYMPSDALCIKYGDLVGNTGMICLDGGPDSDMPFKYGFMPMRED